MSSGCETVPGCLTPPNAPTAVRDQRAAGRGLLFRGVASRVLALSPPLAAEQTHEILSRLPAGVGQSGSPTRRPGGDRRAQARPRRIARIAVRRLLERIRQTGEG